MTYRVRTRDLSGNVSAASMAVRLYAPSRSRIRHLAGLVVSRGLPVGGVTVRTKVRGTRRAWTTNGVGMFLVRTIPAGVHRLRVTRSGYVPLVLSVRVAATGTTARMIALQRS